ncbi:MAG: transketolase [Gammaproteobacteria bacterium]|nr:transketolase [Gammaproteobacteria bacterium]
MAQLATQAARRERANALRALAMDAVQRANSGHPGMPMGMADIAELLYSDYLKVAPRQPHWVDRDRLVLSNGHGSMLLYGAAHLAGYDLDLDQLKAFRQLGSHTAGHPELNVGIGIETTTGPLGQGLANAVGMALAERLLASEFNRPKHEIVDHRTWVLLGDGCLMEGISHEACSLAGVLGLGKLICIYDDNGISIDGEVGAWFRDDTPARFEAYGWHVVRDVDGHDPEALREALDQACADANRPSLVCARTVIGFGAPNKQGTADTHGAPLGEVEIEAARKELNWPHAPFEVPEEIRRGWDIRDRGEGQVDDWNQRFAAYRQAFPVEAAEFERRMDGRLPEGWQASAARAIGNIAAEHKTQATRKASLGALEAFAPMLPELVGGSADLTGSNCTRHSGSVDITAEGGGNYVYFGVREFAMGAMINGLALHGGFIPYAGTFLTFSDYQRNAIRMAALMRQPCIFVFTHDSIGLGEDGPTHQPIEHLESLRIIPNMRVWRPCDALETAVAWRAAIERRDGPTSLVLTRQGLPAQKRSDEQLAQVARGGYVLHREAASAPDVLLIATGSEVPLAMAAAAELQGEGIAARVVSMPCVYVFMQQDAGYRESVLPEGVRARVAVEAGVPRGWPGITGPHGRVLGISRYGASAPGGELFEHFGFTAEAVAALARESVAEVRGLASS